MARMKKFRDDEPKEKVSNTGRSFEDMMRAVPMEQFVRMLTKSGIPNHEARELCGSFAQLKK